MFSNLKNQIQRFYYLLSNVAFRDSWPVMK